jgi:transcriptional regulator with XRE-family HTH domain
MSSERRSTAVDAYVGQRLKQKREAIGLSQQGLAELLGISFQQIQKYERGLNRMGASRLFQLCGVLGVTSSFFFDGLESERAPGMAEADGPNQPLSTAVLLSAPGALDILAEFARITSPARRKKALELVRLLADDEPEA